MKKLFMAILCAFSCSFMVNAQDCMVFYPCEEGSTLVSKTYDANKNLLSTITYVVDESYYYGDDDKTLNMSFTLTNGLNAVIDRGNVEAYCIDGNFRMRMTNRSLSPEVVDFLVENTELVGGFLDYPDIFNSNFPYDNDTFEMDGGEFSIRTKGSRDNLASVNIYNRQFVQTEQVTTPAGTFNASKITFVFDVVRNGNEATYKGVEWYAPRAGIVRSETYDQNDVLLNYSELTTLDDKGGNCP